MHHCYRSINIIRITAKHSYKGREGHGSDDMYMFCGCEKVYRQGNSFSTALKRLLQGLYNLISSFQISPVGTRHPSPTPSCMATLALKWGTSCSTFAPRDTSWATRRRRSRCSATAVGSGMGRSRPVWKVSKPAHGASLRELAAFRQPSQDGFRLTGVSPGHVQSQRRSWWQGCRCLSWLNRAFTAHG